MPGKTSLVRHSPVSSATVGVPAIRGSHGMGTYRTYRTWAHPSPDALGDGSIALPPGTHVEATLPASLGLIAV